MKKEITKSFSHENALDCTNLSMDIILQYFNRGFFLWLPKERWAKMMLYLRDHGTFVSIYGKLESDGIVFQKKQSN